MFKLFIETQKVATRFALLFILLSASAFASGFIDNLNTNTLSLTRRDESSSATINALSTTDTFVKLTSTVSTINGAVAPSASFSKILTISNQTGSDVTISHASASATAANRFALPSSVDMLLLAGASASFIYDLGQSRWVKLSGGKIIDADVKAGAAIARSKTASGTAYRILANDSGGVMGENAAITASRAVASDANGQLVASATTATEQGYVSGVTSSIQTQLNGKEPTVTKGNLTDAGTDGITVTGGTGAVIGSGTSLAQHVADATHNGYLSSTDWSSFNSAASGGVTSFGAFGSTPSANGASVSGNVATLQPADATHPGGVTTGSQTFAGTKTFSSTISGSITGNAATVTTDANLTGPITSVGNATSIASQTGTGTKFVVDTSPTIVTPTIAKMANLTSNGFVKTSGGDGTLGVDTNTYLNASNNLSDVGTAATAFNNISGMTTIGDTIYGGASGVRTRLAGNTTTTKKYKSSTGDGVNATAPVWSQVAFADLSGSASASQLPNPSSSTLGGVESYASVSHQWINTISTSGVPSSTQPAFSDVSGTAAVNQGGTGQTSYTDGQLLIGNSSGNTLTKATLTAGTNITITNGNGSISIAASGGASGTVVKGANLSCVSGGSTINNQTGGGTNWVSSIAGRSGNCCTITTTAFSVQPYCNWVNNSGTGGQSGVISDSTTQFRMCQNGGDFAGQVLCISGG